jgi:TIR domain
LRVFLSYHTPDRSLALGLKDAIERAEPGAHEVFVDQTHLRHGHLWQPALFEAIARAEAFLILVSNHLGDWQKVEFYEARDRKTKDDGFVLLPIIIADRAKGPAANLPGLGQLHWIESTEPTAPKPLAQIIAAMKRIPLATPPEPWRTINPYRGLLALEEQDADFFFGRVAETAEILNIAIAKRDRLIALIGNSGVGKSSLVQAGVIGSLKRQRWPGGAGAARGGLAEVSRIGASRCRKRIKGARKVGRCIGRIPKLSYTVQRAFCQRGLEYGMATAACGVPGSGRRHTKRSERFGRGA